MGKHQPQHAVMSFPEISAHLGISVKRVHAIEQNALRKLRDALVDDADLFELMHPAGRNGRMNGRQIARRSRDV